MSEITYPITSSIEYPDRLSRLLIFVKFILAIPHIVVLALLGIAYLVSLSIAWFAILFTGRYPRSFFDFAVGLLRWSFRLNVYISLMRDEYPPFSFSGPYPAQLDVAYPERLSRWKIFFKFFLAIPHFVILYGYQALAQVIMFIAWFAILFTGRYPKGLFDLVAGYFRWNNRNAAYVLLLTDEYPPFTNA